MPTITASPIAPRIPPSPSTWRDHRGCDWTWQIVTDGPDEAVCIAHNAVFVLPTEAEAYELNPAAAK